MFMVSICMSLKFSIHLQKFRYTGFRKFQFQNSLFMLVGCRIKANCPLVEPGPIYLNESFKLCNNKNFLSIFKCIWLLKPVFWSSLARRIKSFFECMTHISVLDSMHAIQIRHFNYTKYYFIDCKLRVRLKRIFHFN